jgi:hypothetical protein
LVFFSCFILAQLEEFKKKQDQPQNCDGYVKITFNKVWRNLYFCSVLCKGFVCNQINEVFGRDALLHKQSPIMVEMVI